MKKLSAICLLLLFLTASSCQRKEQAASHAASDSSEQALSPEEQMIQDAQQRHDHDRLFQLADSLEQTGDISKAQAAYERGVAYADLKQMRMAEFYWKECMAACDEENGNFTEYGNAAASLSNSMTNKGDYEGALQASLPAVRRMEESGDSLSLSFAVLLESLGRCQLNLGHVGEAAQTFDRAYHIYILDANKDQKSGDGLRHAIIDTHNTALSYLTAKYFKEALYWTNRTDTLLDRYSYMPDAKEPFTDMLKARIAIHRAIALQGLGNTAEAARAYQDYQATRYGHSDDGHIDATPYLVSARRFNEAANDLRDLDRILGEWGVDLSLNNIKRYYFAKYRANLEAGRKDSALAVATRILDILDSTIVQSQNNEAAELAAIYNSQQQENEIAHQQTKIAEQDASLQRQRLIGTLVGSLLIIGFFTIYALYRRRASRRLKATHDNLQAAYAELKETIAAKERMEGELHIARQIQMSMVPSLFPERHGLDIYASMTPAREVGGDLYDFVLLADKLYFCVGDVSGKGVPASLFMAQTTRLFRSLATQQMSPEQIANHMNAALTEHNTQGMFVTMFIGLADLRSGHLDFCNCGHNPPVIGGPPYHGTFVQMESNVPIGLWAEFHFHGEEIDNIKGLPLFIYTDGLNEAENTRQEQFGDDHMLHILRDTKFSSARQVIERMQAEVERHRNGAESNDDLTMMCLRVN